MREEKATTFTNAFGGHAKQYQQSRPTYPDELFEWTLSQISKPAGEVEVWDVGTGNGQAALGMSPMVKHIYASDPSGQQIENAMLADNITYDVSTCALAKIEDASVDLVTAGTAFHWFDREAFFNEVNRVLRPSGVVALFAYGKTHFPDANNEVQDLIHNWSDRTLGPFWDSRVVKLYSGVYESEMPFRTVANPPFSISMDWSRDHLINFIKSWSAYNAFVRKNNTDPFLEIESAFKSLWDRHEIRRVEMDLILRVLKK